VSTAVRVLELHDVDLLLALASDGAAGAKLARAGFPPAAAEVLERERARLVAAVERRWVSLYERSLTRYGRGVTPVRARVCQGCFVTLPTSAAPPAGECELHLCQSCGRLLYWS
jgi:hypothetical protein